MTAVRDGSTDQHEIWNGRGGQAWVEAQSLLDQTFRPLEEALADAVTETSARSVLDIGCGTGATTVAAARRLGEEGSCLGIDLSEPMLEAARARARREGVRVEFVRSDAESHAFEPASFDLFLSRFGIMFFSDPVRAFANLLGAASAGGRLHCIAWRRPEDNPFMTTAGRAAEPLLPGVSRRPPEGPGPFGLADCDRCGEILAKSGWRDVELEPIDVPCAFPASGLDLYVTRLGPVGRALQTVDDATRERVLEAIRPAFDPFRHGSEIRFIAACWLVRARAGG